MLKLLMLMFKTNEPINVAHFQKLANQSLLNGALVMEAEKVLIEKNEDVKIYFH